jgi:hypothetical protein
MQAEPDGKFRMGKNTVAVGCRKPSKRPSGTFLICLCVFFLILSRMFFCLINNDGFVRTHKRDGYGKSSNARLANPEE